MNSELLSISNLNKSFNSKKVLHDVSAEFSAGNFALLGRNGSGKTTLLEILAGCEPADSGTVICASYNMKTSPIKAKARLSYLPDKPTVYPFLEGIEFLDFVAKAKKSKVIPGIKAAEDLGLAPHFHTRFSEMSLGTKRKFMIAAVFIGAPDVILMDEPSNGLDEAAKCWLADQLIADSAKRLTLYSSHDYSFIEATKSQCIEFRQGGTLVPHQRTAGDGSVA